MADLWGFAAGFSQGTQDADQHALAQGKIAMQPYEIQKAQTEAQMDTISLQQAKISLAQQQQVLEYLRKHQQATSTTSQGSGLNGPVDQIGQAADQGSQLMEYLAGAAAAGGKYNEAGGLYEKASIMRKNAAEIQKIHWEEQMKRIEMFANALDTVTPETWEAKNREMQQVTGAPTPFMKQGQDGQWQVEPYDAKKVEWIRHAVETSRVKVQNLQSRAAADKDRAEAGLARKRTEVLPQQVSIAQQRADAAEKRLGKGAVTPSQIRSLMVARIATDYDKADTNTATALPYLALGPATRAQQLIQEKGMSAKDAIDKAYREASIGNEFFGLKPRIDKPDPSEPGRSFERPAAPPKTAAGFEQGYVYNIKGQALAYRPDLNPQKPLMTREKVAEYLKKIKAADDAKVSGD